MQKARRHRTSLLRPLVGLRFQVLFHSLIQSTFHLSLTVLVHYRSLESYLALPDGTGRFRRDFAGPALLRIPLGLKNVRGRGYHPLWLTFPGNFALFFSPTSWSYNPVVAVTTMVWALPCSLATTYGIILIFSSSGYLDVSVLRVCSPCGVTSLQLAGLPHSEISGSLRMCQSPELIAAYHVFLRL